MHSTLSAARILPMVIFGVSIFPIEISAYQLSIHQNFKFRACLNLCFGRFAIMTRMWLLISCRRIILLWQKHSGSKSCGRVCPSSCHVLYERMETFSKCLMTHIFNVCSLCPCVSLRVSLRMRVRAGAPWDSSMHNKSFFYSDRTRREPFSFVSSSGCFWRDLALRLWRC